MKKIFTIFGILIQFCAFSQTGNVGIGTTDPKAQLHTTGSVRHDILKGSGVIPVYADDNGELIGAPKVFTNNTVTPVPEALCGEAVSEINVTGMPSSVSSSTIFVKLNISAAYLASIYVVLIAPGGETLMLATQTRANYTNVVFFDGASRNISEATEPFAGYFKPRGTIGRFCTTDGNVGSFGAIGGGSVVPNGNWKLKVMRVTGSSVPVSFLNWSISFDARIVPLPIPANVVAKSSGSGTFMEGSIYDNGKVGIGTTNPQTALDVEGVVDATSYTGDGSYLTNVVNTQFHQDIGGIKNFMAEVGIGVPTPTEKLDVNGNVKATKFLGDGGALTNVVYTTGTQTIEGSKKFTENVEVDGNVIATGYSGDGSTLKGLVTLTTAQSVGGVKNFTGNLGLGEASPNAPLQFAKGVANRKIVLFEVGNNDHQYYGFGVNNNALRYQVNFTESDHIFYAGLDAASSKELMRIKGNGKVTIGTSTPLNTLSNPQFPLSDAQLSILTTTAASEALHVKSTQAVMQGLVMLEKSGNAISGDNYVVFRANDNTIGSISASGGLVSYNATSDKRLKENIRPTTYGLSDALKIQVVDYNYKAVKNIPQTGFLAQQLYDIYPIAVTKGGKDVSQPWMVDYSKITPLLVRAIQEQQEEMEALKRKSLVLEQQVTALQTDLKQQINEVRALLGARISESKASTK